MKVFICRPPITMLSKWEEFLEIGTSRFVNDCTFFQNPTRTEISGFEFGGRRPGRRGPAAAAARSKAAADAAAATMAGEAGPEGAFEAAAASAGAATAAAAATAAGAAGVKKGSGRVSGWYKSPSATAPNLPGLGVERIKRNTLCSFCLCIYTMSIHSIYLDRSSFYCSYRNKN